MKNFSEIILNTSKEQVINMACSVTGMSNIVIGKIYESAKINGKSEKEIISYFENITQPKIAISSKTFLSEISELIKESSLSSNNSEDKHKLTFKFLSILNEIDNDKKIDSVTLIDTINNILIINDVKARKKLLPILELPLIELNNLLPLNESFNFSLNSEKNNNNIFLFEGLKEILNKNNKRWGVTYHIENSYKAIMNYIDEEIQQIELETKMYSVSNEYHINLLNNMLSGNVDPLNKHISSVKNLIPDLQTLVFDMILLCNKFIETNNTSLEYIKRQTLNDYKDATNFLLKSIVSSTLSSHIIDEKSKKEYFEKPDLTQKDDNSDFYKYSSKDNVLVQLTLLISNDKLKYNTWNIGLKSVIDMLNFIKSASTEFNMKIRPILRTYITKAYELTASVEKANTLHKQIRNY